jgi:hypothetical protein
MANFWYGLSSYFGDLRDGGVATLKGKFMREGRVGGSIWLRTTYEVASRPNRIHFHMYFGSFRYLPRLNQAKT